MSTFAKKLKKAKKLIKEANEELDYQQYKQMLYKIEDKITEILKLFNWED